MNRQPRERATLTSAQGIYSIDDLVRTIDSIPDLKKSNFGKSVRIDLISMRARLADDAFFSMAMQRAIEGWGRGIGKWIPLPDTVQ